MSGSWLADLPGKHGPADEFPFGSADAVQVSELLGDNAVWWADGVGWTMARRITETLPDLGSNAAHLRVLQRGTASTVLRSILVLFGTSDELVTTEALDAARDFARRGMSLGSILRGIRLGQACMNEAFLDVLETAGPPEWRASEMRRVSKILLEQIDAFSTAMEAEFRQEYEHGTAAAAAARIQMVNKVLSGDVGPEAASRSLGYPVDRRHLGLVAWTRDPGAGADDVVRKAATAVLQAAGCVRLLFVPVGAGVLWGWGSLPDAQLMPAVRQAALPPQVEVAVGEAGTGAAGFRSTHAEARAVERLLRLGGRRRDPVTLHQDVVLAVLLTADLDGATTFVRRTLGGLCEPDPRTTETRDTLRCYLDAGRSLATVAERLQVARNTVTYRVRRAEELSGRSVDADHLALHAALLLYDCVAIPAAPG